MLGLGTGLLSVGPCVEGGSSLTNSSLRGRVRQLGLVCGTAPGGP